MSLLTSRVSCLSPWARHNFPAPLKIEQTLCLIGKTQSIQFPFVLMRSINIFCIFSFSLSFSFMSAPYHYSPGLPHNCPWPAPQFDNSNAIPSSFIAFKNDYPVIFAMPPTTPSPTLTTLSPTPPPSPLPLPQPNKKSTFEFCVKIHLLESSKLEL